MKGLEVNVVRPYRLNVRDDSIRGGLETERGKGPSVGEAGLQKVFRVSGDPSGPSS